MKKSKMGKIDISVLNMPPERQEYEAAKYFAERGKDVVFIKPSDIKGQHTPDFIIDNKMWELKSPVIYSKSSFENNLKAAIKQSENIIYDLRRLRKEDELIYIKELQKRCKIHKIKNLIIITRDGQLLTLKGDFGKMQVEVARPRAA